jgi:hypothetical protein
VIEDFLTADYGLRIADCGLRIADCGLRIDIRRTVSRKGRHSKSKILGINKSAIRNQKILNFCLRRADKAARNM